jgi:hypothetical protein
MQSFSFKLILFAQLTLCFTSFSLSSYGFHKYKDNKSIAIDERIVVNTDRKVYVAGENVLFSLYLIDIKNRSLAFYPSIGYVIIRDQQGNVIGKSQVKIHKGLANGAIYISDTVQTGYYQLVAYTNFMRNGPDTSFFNSQILLVNRFDRNLEKIFPPVLSYAKPSEVRNDTIKTITFKGLDTLNSNIIFDSTKTGIYIHPFQTQYNKRTKVTVKLDLMDKQLPFADISISIVEKNVVEQQTIKENNLIQSADLNSPNINFKLTSGTYIHLAEDKTAELMGRLVDPNGNGVGYHTLYLSSPDTFANFEYANTDAEGYFRFALTDYYNGKDLFIKMKQSQGEVIVPKIIIDSKFNYEGQFKPVYWTVDSSLINYIQRSQDMVKVQKSFSLISSSFHPQTLKINFPYLYKVPDHRIYPSEYAELKDFHEIAREILPTVRVRKHANNYSVEVLDLSIAQFLPSSPMIFLDGVLIDEVDQIIPYGTKDISRIDIISGQWMVDHNNLSGIISITSRNKLWKSLTLNTDNISFKAENFFDAPPVSNPNYSILDKTSRDPDFRQLLYWNPNLRINAGHPTSIEFYTSDYSAPYLIKVEGINCKGERIEASSEIEVIE